MARKMNKRTQGLKNFVNQALTQLQCGNVKEAEYTLINLIENIGGAYRCIEPKLKKTSPVPKYNPKKDGDYHRFLVRNNCD